MRNIFEQARVEIVAAIDQAARGITPALPNHLLSYFDRFGRSLRIDESIVFDSETQKPISYTPLLRKRLVQLAQVETWTEEVALRGRIPAINQDKLGFQLQLRDGTKLPAPLTDQHLAAVLDAVNGYRAGAHVLLQGVVKKDRLDHMQAFETVDVGLMTRPVWALMNSLPMYANAPTAPLARALSLLPSPGHCGCWHAEIVLRTED
jgi:hypothetical protein